MELKSVLEKKLKSIISDDVFSITKNKKHGQSETFTIFNSTGAPICIAKFFDYLEGEKLKESLGTSYINSCNNLDELLDNIDCIEDIPWDVENVVESINLQKRCFKRYVDVCSIEGLKCFPELLAYTEEIKVNNTFYGLLIEEFITGETLDKAFVPTEIIDINLIINFLEQMGKIVKKMNENGIVHRDISPDNIMYANNQFILIDPGMVKIEDDTPTTKSIYLLGKKHYASPEQFMGYAKNVTFSSDLYAVGIIALELILKKNPLKEIIDKGSYNGKIPHLELLNRYDRDIEDLFYTNLDEDGISAILFVILKKMIQVEVRLRYDTIDSFILSIQSLRERMDD
ncbi:hypothetical protein VL4N_14060 [Vagococcus lutrae]|uniref:serine/threonine protein kinase n=1 Tax=Vagococcus lutrae TaxID=81947 RepID=UPI001927DC24|nr:protein kinase [Vagococcus lutrae]GEQ62032.1 hypothetical protein VL2N_13680 [Vagococcus lutrae]GEQ63995.1 hypothetical protein VL3N_14370 [Vagococcus lutrae]GEQ65856.1 hypothetical protein VL4N_14060 [Vagococcus lutrae]